MNTRLALIALAATLMYACGNSKKEELKTLKNEVMAVHDEVMPKMGDLMKAQKALKLKADSLMETSDSLAAQGYYDAAAKIDSANESMMNWMRNFQANFQGTDEELTAYLNEQKATIQKVKDDMLNSLEEGKKKLE